MTNISMDFDTAFERATKRVEEILVKAPIVVRTYTSHLAKAQGKCIRTYALLACAMDENDQIKEDAVIFAAAIEILHLATLVHDDIMDDANLRRGIETIHKKYGKKTAVICGDYLLAAALKEMLRVEEKQAYEKFYLTDYVGRICMGELRQNLNNGNLNLSMYRYLSIINGKTAALFEASFYGGAILCESVKERLNHYRKLGQYIGIIFQLTDDCIDFEAAEDSAGKNVQSDYEQGVITLPLIYTLKEREDFRHKAELNMLDREEINRTVRETGGLDFTRKISARYYKKAEKVLDLLKVGPSISEAKEKQLIWILNKAFYGLKSKA